MRCGLCGRWLRWCSLWETVACYARGTRGAAVFGNPGESGAAVMDLNLVGLFPSGESVVGLGPEKGAIVCAKLFIEEDVA